MIASPRFSVIPFRAKVRFSSPASRAAAGVIGKFLKLEMGFLVVGPSSSN